MNRIKRKLSELLEYATGGMYSDASRDIEEMRQQVDNWRQDVCNKCKKPERVNRRRPCEVDGSKAWYHGLIQSDRAILRADAYEGKPDAYAACYREFSASGRIPMYCDVVIERRTYAMIEYLDGSVSKVDPEKVHFINI